MGGRWIIEVADAADGDGLGQVEGQSRGAAHRLLDKGAAADDSVVVPGDGHRHLAKGTARPNQGAPNEVVRGIPIPIEIKGLGPVESAVEISLGDSKEVLKGNTEVHRQHALDNRRRSRNVTCSLRDKLEEGGIEPQGGIVEVQLAGGGVDLRQYMRQFLSADDTVRRLTGQAAVQHLKPCGVSLLQDLHGGGPATVKKLCKRPAEGTDGERPVVHDLMEGGGHAVGHRAEEVGGAAQVSKSNGVGGQLTVSVKVKVELNLVVAFPEDPCDLVRDIPHIL